MHGCSIASEKMLAPSSTKSHINRLANASGLYSSRSSSISNRVAATALRVEDVDDLPPGAVLTTPAAGQCIVRDIDLDALCGRFALVAALAGPEGVGLMGHAGWRAEIGLAPLLVHRHAAGDLVQFVEPIGPEELVEVEIAVVTLRGARIGSQEEQLGAVGKHDAVAAGKRLVDRLAHELLHVATEQMRLCLGCAKEYLIAPGGERIDQRLTGEVKRRTDLTRLQDDAGTLVAGPVPIALIVEAAVDECRGQLLDLFLSEVVALGLLFFGAALRLATAGFKSASLPPPW